MTGLLTCILNLIVRFLNNSGKYSHDFSNLVFDKDEIYVQRQTNDTDPDHKVKGDIRSTPTRNRCDAHTRCGNNRGKQPIVNPHISTANGAHDRDNPYDPGDSTHVLNIRVTHCATIGIRDIMIGATIR